MCKNEIVQFYKKIEDDKLEFAVILCKSDSKWVLCKSKLRTCYEFPGGKREKGETILQTAKRELYEETGAIEFNITPISIYSMEDTESQRNKFGMLYYGEIFKFSTLPEKEIEKIKFFKRLPKNLRYPEIYKILIKKIAER